MKKRTKIWYLILGLFFISAYTLIMLWVRKDNPTAVRTQYFTAWRKSYLVQMPKTKSSYVRMTVNGEKRYTTSEAIGYGMYLTVMGADSNPHAQRDFKELTRYYLDHRLKKSYLMSWRQHIKGKKYVADQTSASDGDIIIAHALILAYRKWRQPSYRKLAKKLAADIMASEINQQNYTVQLGNWVSPKSKYYHYIRTSDCIPYAFDDLYDLTGDKRWIKVRQSMLHYLGSLSAQHKTGLIPDFAKITGQKAVPAKPNSIATKEDGDYSYNSCRIPMLLAGYQKNGAPKILHKMLRFFKNTNYAAAGYKLNGKPLTLSQSASFDAPVFAAVNVDKTPEFSDLYMRTQYIFARKLPTDNYYDATLTLLALYETPIKD